MDDLDDNIFSKGVKKSIAAPSKTLPVTPASKPAEMTPSKTVQPTAQPTRELFC